jgi:hypothetical protein
MMVIGVMILGFIATTTYWLAFMLLEGVVQDPQIWTVAG